MKKYISIAFVVALVAAAAGCGAAIAFAQERGGASLPPPVDSGGGVPPPSVSGGGGEGGGGGVIESGRMMPSTMGGGENNPPNMPMPVSPMQPQGEPFREGGRDNAQGQPFMGEGMPQGRPFGGGPEGSQEGWGGPEMGNRGNYGGGEGDGQMMGPSPEEMERMQAEQERRMEEQEKRMRDEQLRQMKRSFGGMEQGLKQIKRLSDRLQKKGVAVPAEATALVSDLSAALAKVKDASELSDDVEAAMEVIQDRGPDLGDVGQRLGMLEQLSQTTKEVEKQFTRLDKAVAKAKKRKEASQYPEVVAKIDAQVGALKQRWAEVKNETLAGDADPEDLQDTMQEIFEAVDESYQSVGLLQQLGSVAKMVKSAEKEIVKFEKEAARQKKAGKDVSALTALIGAARAKLQSVTALSKQSGFDPEDIFDLMQELDHIRNQAVDELDRLSGKVEKEKLAGAVIQALELRRLGF